MANKLALVTGASSGIGLSVAKELACRGYDLIICSSGERMEAAAEELRSADVDVLELEADLSVRSDVEDLWDWVKSSGRPVDIACINAGERLGGLFQNTDLDTELKMVALNCAGTVQLAKYVVREMVEQGGGGILFTSPFAGEMTAPREAVYAATKSFLLSFAHSLCFELQDSGVVVTALQSGQTDADFVHRAGMNNTQAGAEGKNGAQPDEVARRGIEALLAGRDHVYGGSAKPGMHEKMVLPCDRQLG